MKWNEISKSALNHLSQNDVNQNNFIYACQMDLSFEGQYQDGYVILTDEYLMLLTNNEKQIGIKYFKGVSEEHKDLAALMTTYELKSWSLDTLTGFTVERMVATNLLVARENEETVRIAACTNIYLEDLNQLIKLLELPKNERRQAVLDDNNDHDDEDELYCPKCHTKYPDENRKVCPKCMNKKSVFFRALGYFLKYKGMIVVLALCYILTSLLSIAWPYLSGTVLYDMVLARNDAFLAGFGKAGQYVAALGVLVILIVGIKVIQLITGIIQGTAMAKVVTLSIRDMKKDVFSSMENLSMSFYTSRQTGTLMTRVLRDAERVTDFFIEGLPYLIINSITIIATFSVMFYLNWQMSIVACILLPLLIVISVKLKPALWTLFGRRHRAESAVNSKVNDNLTGARVVRAFGQQAAEIEGFEAPNDYLRDAEVRIVKYNNKFTLLYEMVQVISSVWVWALGVLLVLHFKSISLGVLITFVGYVDQLNGPMKFFSWIFRLWSDSINAAQRMFEIVDTTPDVVESDKPIRLENPRGEIEIKNMTFGYDHNHPVLSDINLHVKPGEMLGIVGRSGAGKTTLVNLLSRLYDVNEGEILIDGINVKDLSFNDLRKNIAMVSQDTYLFMGTVAENIAYADENVSRDKIIEAAKLAGAHDFISRMPDGYDTVIGAAGKSLSGGEKQRISIARAIIANPKILILDEATASVDTETEKLIQNSLNMLIQGRTTLSIAHRLSTLRDANHLIVIDGGHIAEEGTRQELEDLGGIYHNLMELQTKSLQLRGLE